ncbi:MAG: IPTL-CTERM sorting domain-containing protein [Burkholderiaceae bacterium]|jgi:hypothetical protein|nr:IPTL-CTERM sorting domain-containing protein [Burkholderiaceae bacterium]
MFATIPMYHAPHWSSPSGSRPSLFKHFYAWLAIMSALLGALLFAPGLAQATSLSLLTIDGTPTSTTADFRITLLDANGTGFWLVQPAGDPAPTPITISLSGNSGPMVMGTPFTGQLTGLTPGTDYMLYFIASDGSIISNIASVAFTTGVPVLTALTASGITATGASFSITSDASATGYWLVRLASDPAPTPIDISLGGNSGPMTMGTPFTRSVAGLTPSTNYVLYFIASQSGATSSVASAPFTTLALSAGAATAVPTLNEWALALLAAWLAALTFWRKRGQA